ncbi:MAG: TetR/AcrR family transcriptional regulator [Mesonia hippocampi]|uniref:TetR/AcrR family transcriptional regulator n=1 Tax=Mesonia hippocampi TaxID=1628250 RepID=UPI003F9CD187
MKQKILNQATELFLELGFKSVTMDDIAEKLGISKKTIYTYYNTKNKLIKSSTELIIAEIFEKTDAIIAKNLNPIEEMLEIHEYILTYLKEEKNSVQYQLKKYYPSIDESVSEHKRERMNLCVTNNLKRGVEMGFYRKNLKTDIIYRFYFTQLEGIRNDDFFTIEKYGIPELVHTFLDYHIRGIATKKGLTYINNLQKQIIS